MAITYDDNAIEVCGAPANDDAGNSESGRADCIPTVPADNPEAAKGQRKKNNRAARADPRERSRAGIDPANDAAGGPADSEVAADRPQLELDFLGESRPADPDEPDTAEPDLAGHEAAVEPRRGAGDDDGPDSALTTAEFASVPAPRQPEPEPAAAPEPGSGLDDSAASADAAAPGWQTAGRAADSAPAAADLAVAGLAAAPGLDSAGLLSTRLGATAPADEVDPEVSWAILLAAGPGAVAGTCAAETAEDDTTADEATEADQISAADTTVAQSSADEATAADADPERIELDDADLGQTDLADTDPADTDPDPDDIDSDGADCISAAASSADIAGIRAAAGVAAPAAAKVPAGYMQTDSGVARLDPVLAKSGFGYERYTSLAGPLTRPPRDQAYRVQYRTIHSSRREWLATRAITLSLVALDIRFMYWLIFQSQYPHLQTWLWQTSLHALATDGYVTVRALMAAGSIVMQLFLLINVLTVSRACLAARDPVPVEPDPDLRVAFLTTIVPDREPLELAERTLRAASEIAYAGKLDLWLLDEGDSEQAKEMCGRLGVHHFSRKGRGYLELESGTFASRTKHGNHNRWLWEHAGDYDVVMFVDTDHVPLPIMAERLLGYFRDPEVAFVVAPQFYGNTENRITRWAESAQYLFHSVIQRAGNRRNCAMLVGTNAAVRTSAIKHGYTASITEDMATSIKIHTTKSDVTGRAWRSVYTPDLVAVGEGPATWTEFFGQQTRWSAGTYDALTRQVWRMIFKLRPGAMLHYLLMLTYYPSVAIGWLMGITVSACYLGFGISSLRTNEGWWLTYYVDVGALQFLLYRFMRLAQREPARACRVVGDLGHGGQRAHGPHLRQGADEGAPRPQARLQRNGQGVVRDGRPAGHLSLLADLGAGAGRRAGDRAGRPPALSDDDRLDCRDPGGLSGPGPDLALGSLASIPARFRPVCPRRGAARRGAGTEPDLCRKFLGDRLESDCPAPSPGQDRRPAGEAGRPATPGGSCWLPWRFSAC